MNKNIGAMAAAMLTIISVLFAGAWVFMRFMDDEYMTIERADSEHIQIEINALEMNEMTEAEREKRKHEMMGLE